MTGQQIYVEYPGSPKFIAAGQQFQVQARVILQLREPMRAGGVTVHISGKAECHWTGIRARTRTENCRQDKVTNKDRRNDNDNSRTYIETIAYHEEEPYVNYSELLWVPPDKLIPAGRHQFPFAFTVLAHARPSYEGSYGHIRYTSSVIIDRPGQPDKEISSSFAVVALKDLNTMERALPPVDQYMQTNIGIWLSTHGKLGVRVRLPQSGFVPGEKVQIDVEVDNHTTKEVRKVEAKL